MYRSVTFKSSKIPSKSIFTSDWLDWYRGKVRGFHNYRLYNGNNEVEIERKSLQMAKQVCETWANLLLNERCDIVLGNDEDKKLLDEILMDTNFWVKGNEGIEKSFALSYGASDFYQGWMKNPRSAMISCNDGFRPVSFYLEVIDD